MSSSAELEAPDEPPSDQTGGPTEAPGGAIFWIGAAIGIAVMAFGLRGLFQNSRGTRPFEFAKWFVGADLLHDLVIAPIAVLVGFIVARLLPRPWRLPVQAGLFATAIVLAVGWAPWRGYGRAVAVGNDTVLPLDYSTAIATVVGVVWAAIAIWLGVIALRRASRRTPPRSAAPGAPDPAS